MAAVGAAAAPAMLHVEACKQLAANDEDGSLADYAPWYCEVLGSGRNM